MSSAASVVFVVSDLSHGENVAAISVYSPLAPFHMFFSAFFWGGVLSSMLLGTARRRRLQIRRQESVGACMVTPAAMATPTVVVEGTAVT